MPDSKPPVTPDEVLGRPVRWLKIGPDLNLLIDAVNAVARSKRPAVGPSWVQRHVRVGFAKAAHLTMLLEQEGVIAPRDGKGWHRVLLAAGALEEALDRIRAAAKKESEGG